MWVPSPISHTLHQLGWNSWRRNAPSSKGERVVSVEPSVDDSHQWLFGLRNKPGSEPPSPLRCSSATDRLPTHHIPFHQVAFCTPQPYSGACWLHPQDNSPLTSGSASKGSLLTTSATCSGHLSFLGVLPGM